VSARQSSVIALIPARGGSLRVPGKNVRPLAGHPLIAYAIAGARESGLFDRVIVSTDSEDTAAVAQRYGGEVPFLRPAEHAGATSPDIDWVSHLLGALPDRPDAFAILRPTSPFRTAATIRRAHERFVRLSAAHDIDSIRAVEVVKQHPGKMWVLEGDLMRPLLEQPEDAVPWHSSQFQALPTVHVQNSSLEIAWSRVVTEQGTLAGRVLAPFLTEGHEGFSIDYPEDWERAEHLASSGEAQLPDVGATSAPGRG
jgi:N-acylneuraminate cytidylyltransferase